MELGLKNNKHGVNSYIYDPVYTPDVLMFDGIIEITNKI